MADHKDKEDLVKDHKDKEELVAEVKEDLVAEVKDLELVVGLKDREGLEADHKGLAFEV